ncbi:MAG TPA: WD40 repeat domain-containing protein [Gemmataceae bacterium]|nr:WD40 repeat domain-containing protein [Gemmataceae bacterium]
MARRALLAAGLLFCILASDFTLAESPPVLKDRFDDPLPANALARLGTIRWRHGGTVTFAAFLPDGKSILTAGQDYKIRVWEMGSGKEIRTFDEIPKLPNQPNEEELYTGLPFQVTMSADCKTLVSFGQDGRVHVWDTGTGKLRTSFSLSWPRGPNAPVNPFPGGGSSVMSVSPDGKQLAVSNQAGEIAIHDVWDKAGQRTQRSLVMAAANNAVVNNFSPTVQFSPDGKLLASAGVHAGNNNNNNPPFQLRVWDVASGKQLFSHDLENQGTAATLVFSADSKRLALTNQASGIHIYDLDSRKLWKKLRQQNDATGGMVFTPDGKKLLIKSVLYSNIREIDLQSDKVGRRIGRAARQNNANDIGGMNSASNGLILSADGKHLAVVGESNSLRIIELASNKELIEPKGHTDMVNWLRFAPDQKSVWTMGQDGRFCTWDSTTGEENVKERIQHRMPVNGMGFGAISADGKLLALYADDGSIEVRDMRTKKKVQSIPMANGGGMQGLAFSPDGKILAGAAMGNGDDAAVRFYDVATGKELSHHPVPCTPGNPIGEQGLVFSSDGRLIVVPAEDTSLVLYEVATGKELRRIVYNEQPGPPRGIVFSPDGRSLLLDFGPGYMALYELATGRERRLFGQRDAAVDPLAPPLNVIGGDVFDFSPLAFAPDGRLVAQGALHGNVGLWEVSSGRKLGEFQGHRGDVTAVMFSRDGQRLASGSADTTALIWDVTKLLPAKKPEPRKLKLQELQTCWADLLSPDAAKAFVSMDMLAGAPAETITMLKEQLTKPPVPLNVKQIEQWIGELDHPRYAVRQRATGELARLGDDGQPFFQNALKNHPAPEARRRLYELMERTGERYLTAEKLRVIRAIELLDRLDSPTTREVLQHLAQGPVNSPITREARWSLMRRE